MVQVNRFIATKLVSKSLNLSDGFRKCVQRTGFEKTVREYFLNNYVPQGLERWARGEDEIKRIQQEYRIGNFKISNLMDERGDSLQHLAEYLAAHFGGKAQDYYPPEEILTKGKVFPSRRWIQLDKYLDWLAANSP